MQVEYSVRKRVGIIGVGMVGQQQLDWLVKEHEYQRGVDLFCFDINECLGYSDDVNQADIIFVCVPTPSFLLQGCDLSAVRLAIEFLAPGKTVVLRSTVPPGTTEMLQREFQELFFIFAPESLTERQAELDFERPFRVVLAPTEKSIPKVGAVLRLMPRAYFTWPSEDTDTKHWITPTEAELAKYFCNIFGYIKTCMTEIFADSCFGTQLFLNALCIDTVVRSGEILDVVGTDPRITKSWLTLGKDGYHGVGGVCLPKDVRAFCGFLRTQLSYLRRMRKMRTYYNQNQNLGIFIKRIKIILNILESFQKYNDLLLEEQGLSGWQVEMHFSESNIENIVPIRTRELYLQEDFHK